MCSSPPMARAVATRSPTRPGARLATLSVFSTTRPPGSEMEKLEIVFDPLPSDSLSRFITESLASYNVAATGQESWHPVGFFLKSARGEWLGGLLGNIWGGWLHVTHLWVVAPVRNHGNGTRLLLAAQKY